MNELKQIEKNMNITKTKYMDLAYRLDRLVSTISDDLITNHLQQADGNICEYIDIPFKNKERRSKRDNNQEELIRNSDEEVREKIRSLLEINSVINEKGEAFMQDYQALLCKYFIPDSYSHKRVKMDKPKDNNNKLINEEINKIFDIGVNPRSDALPHKIEYVNNKQLPFQHNDSSYTRIEDIRLNLDDVSLEINNNCNSKIKIKPNSFIPRK